jgi:hypothetical protein
VKNASAFGIPQSHAAIAAACEGNCTASGKLPENDCSIVTSQNSDASGAKIQKARCLVIAARQQAAAIWTKSCPIDRSSVPIHFTMVKERLLMQRAVKIVVKWQRIRLNGIPQQRLLHPYWIPIDKRQKDDQVPFASFCIMPLQGG